MGKMGHAIAELAPARGWEVVARSTKPTRSAASRSESLGGADVAVEFTDAGGGAGEHSRDRRGRLSGRRRHHRLVRRAADASRPTSQATDGALLTATNFSLGVNIFEQVAATRGAPAVGSAPGFEAHLVETHHSAKKDAPSGTANDARAARHRRRGGAIFRSRACASGSVPGTHEFIFDAPFEQIHLEHIARDRRVFAEGALVAAAWLIGKHGVFTMQDVLGDGTT